jgi:uncharacterized protein YkwD
VRRAAALLLAVAVGLVVATGLLTTTAHATGSSEKNLPSLNRQVFAAINKFRVAHGLVALRNSGALARSARQHSLEMGKDGYFDHPSADGSAFWKRIQHYYPANGYSYWSVGENLVWQAPSLSAAAALSQWIASPPHLKNLLSPQWRQIGVSAVTVADAPGVYHDRRVTIITTDFGVRR